MNFHENSSDNPRFCGLPNQGINIGQTSTYTPLTFLDFWRSSKNNKQNNNNNNTKVKQK